MPYTVTTTFADGTTMDAAALQAEAVAAATWINDIPQGDITSIPREAWMRPEVIGWPVEGARMPSQSLLTTRQPKTVWTPTDLSELAAVQDRVSCFPELCDQSDSGTSIFVIPGSQVPLDIVASSEVSFFGRLQASLLYDHNRAGNTPTYPNAPAGRGAGYFAIAYRALTGSSRWILELGTRMHIYPRHQTAGAAPPLTQGGISYRKGGQSRFSSPGGWQYAIVYVYETPYPAAKVATQICCTNVSLVVETHRV